MPNASFMPIMPKMPYLTHISYIDMAIWVSKHVSGPQECKPMPLNEFSIGLMP